LENAQLHPSQTSFHSRTKHSCNKAVIPFSLQIHDQVPFTHLSLPSAQVFRTTHDVFPRTFFRPPASRSFSVSSRVARQHRHASGSGVVRGRVRQPSCGRPLDGPVPRTMTSILADMRGLVEQWGNNEHDPISFRLRVLSWHSVFARDTENEGSVLAIVLSCFIVNSGAPVPTGSRQENLNFVSSSPLHA
jgi:hypothetical protein